MSRIAHWMAEGRARAAATLAEGVCQWAYGESELARPRVFTMCRTAAFICAHAKTQRALQSIKAELVDALAVPTGSWCSPVTGEVTHAVVGELCDSQGEDVPCESELRQRRLGLHFGNLTDCPLLELDPLADVVGHSVRGPL